MAKVAYLREEIPVPENVNVEVRGKTVKVSGPKGVLERDFSHANNVIIKIDNGKIVFETFFANRRQKAVFYSVLSHVKNMITGVLKGWRYKLRVVTTHFPATVKIVGNEVVIDNFLGERHPRKAKILEGVNVRLEGRDVIVVEGIDREKVAQTAANIELATRVKDKDRRIFVDGVYIYESGVAE
uniref:Large ribosomal subunit protein uL6 n=1 Tax=Ignisphaera aggregans TaxID=334771 RepID=A0A7C2ZBY6_9CREN